MTNLSINDISKISNCEVINLNSEDIKFSGIAPLDRADKNQISFLINDKYLNDVYHTNAGAIICSKKAAELFKEKVANCLIICDNPHVTLAKISQIFFKPTHPFNGISDHAIIDKSAEIHPSATIFPFVFIGPGARIGAHSVIYSNCFIGAASTIGEDCILYPNVVLREGCRIGNRCILNPGVVVGGDGFGFAADINENVKIPQIGGVFIEDDVEIGANSTIDRGAMSDTKIGRQTKIDNLVMVAHNVVIGELCFIAGQVGIAGSTTVGNKVVMAGQVGVSGHVKIGDKAMLTAQSGISKNIPSEQIWGGSPARPFKEYTAHLATLNKIVKQTNKKSS
ncbi:UDP-3-O-(3-hydroxymyristoyl)glucosamine N-acyltransferase [Fluviispira multicolorata]|uniref:UDP-3-O-acylglucosamine N-acyltransferase n=1 Tax=Fluviispira multicolorata TaxID=2654512 RepID=A0A833JAW3_9BACT|nr:UDP-3-O-(3-hydroxymyristoyl)glucosamine N-acyltransferase [Fluviispira multicolorata]KAB8028465.1 UDP-3-O-(3-hydroxymyristoyl)glucosamine N-acyltransferase [Fluviispira multicolorata]